MPNRRDVIPDKIAKGVERLWYDPVWSKVIATGIIAIIGSILVWAGAYFGSVMTVLAVGLAAVFGIGIGFILFRSREIHPDANVKMLEIGIAPFAKDANFPLKCRIQFRNDSVECADVRIYDYKPCTVTLKQFVVDVLQLRLREEWCPRDEGLDHIAVLPGQRFRAWVGPDETKFTEDQARQLIGKIGTLVLRVNSQNVSFEI